jgi:excisionase family DNA binding protein
MATAERWVGVEEVATHLGVAKDSVYRWVEAKSLPARRVGRLLRFKLSEVDEWVTASGGDDSSSASAKISEARPESRTPNVKKKRGHG